MKSLLREPLIHFLLIGAALFLIYSIVDDQASPQSTKIVVTGGDINTLKANFARKWQRQPTQQELEGLIDEYTLTEIYYREAVALGLDQNDLIIRRRLKQKLELMNENIAGQPVPTDNDLEDFLNDHPERFQQDPQLSFRQIYFNVDRRGEVVMEEASQLRAKLNSEGNGFNQDSLGDALMLPKEFTLVSAREVSRLFGEQFRREIMQIDPGAWHGPLRSGYGLHLVQVSQRIDGHIPELSEIREAVEREWLSMKRKQFKQSLDKTLREKYNVVYEQSDSGGA